MKLENKRKLAMRTFDVGGGRVTFNKERLSEIKEAITKQDMKDLKESGAISIKEKKGKKKVVRRTTRRRAGSIKIKVNTRKRDYMTMTRKLRAYLSRLKARGEITPAVFTELRKQIRTKAFKSLAHLKEHMAEDKKWP